MRINRKRWVHKWGSQLGYLFGYSKKLLYEDYSDRLRDQKFIE